MSREMNPASIEVDLEPGERRQIELDLQRN
jgi:hypothetical protein